VDELDRAGMTVVPSDANFVAFRVRGFAPGGVPSPVSKGRLILSLLFLSFLWVVVFSLFSLSLFPSLLFFFSLFFFFDVSPLWQELLRSGVMVQRRRPAGELR